MLFSEITNRSRISFWCTFSSWFFHKNVPDLIFYQLTKFQCHKFSPSHDIKQNVLLSSYLDNWWHHLKIYLRWSSKAMADREQKNGKTNIKKCEYLESEKRFLNEIKSIFLNYLRATIWWKKWKIADTSFKRII